MSRCLEEFCEDQMWEVFVKRIYRAAVRPKMMNVIHLGQIDPIFSSRSTLNTVSFRKILPNKHIHSFNKHYLLISMCQVLFNDLVKRIKIRNNSCPQRIDSILNVANLMNSLHLPNVFSATYLNVSKLSGKNNKVWREKK